MKKIDQEFMHDPEITHMVVCRGGKVVHDPHPSRAGLQSIEAFEILFRL